MYVRYYMTFGICRTQNDMTHDARRFADQVLPAPSGAAFVVDNAGGLLKLAPELPSSMVVVSSEI